MTHHGGSFYGIIGEDFAHLGKYKQVINADVLDAWFNPAPNVLKKLAKFVNLSCKMPPPQKAYGLIDTISKVRKINKDRLLTGSGSSSLIFTYFFNQVHANDTVTILDPMYGEYNNICQKINARITYHKLRPEDNFKTDSVPLNQFVVVVNPNSPTGQMMDNLGDMVKSNPDTTFFVDEAYIDFVDKNLSLEQLELRNLVVLKSMSKVYALSGARVAYLVADPDVIQRLEQFTPPWNVSTQAQIAAIESLRNEKYYVKKHKQTRQMCQEMMEALGQHEAIKVYPSQVNYFMIELKKHKASEVCAKLTEKNIFLRNCDSMSTQFQDNFIRIAVKNKRQNETILKELLEIL